MMIILNGITEGALFEGRLKELYLLCGSGCIFLLGQVEQY